MEPIFENKIALWDDPVKAPDTLNRTQFAERICEGITSWQSPESLIIGVYAPWGNGKTWLLNKVREKLDESGNVKVCRFAPWQFNSNEQITAEFFATVLEGLEIPEDSTKFDQNAAERAKKWKRLGQLATVGQLGAVAAAPFLDGTPLPFAPALGALSSLFQQGEQGAQDSIETSSIETLREKLLELFGDDSAPRILVAIDDLDRLESEQIRMVFRLLKTCANFPNLNYIVLGERAQLASALNDISDNQGDRYLEKIVQIPITLPQAGALEVRSRLWDGLEVIADQGDYKLEKHVERFEAFWREFLRCKLKNYRAVHRLLTTVSFHAGCLTRNGLLEVDLLDLLGLDFARLFAPALYQALADDPIDGAWMVTHRLRSSEESKEDSPQVLALIEESGLEFDCALHLLINLFPDLYDFVPETIQARKLYRNSQQGYELTAVDHPIADERFQSLYFQLTPSKSHLPSSEYHLFKSHRLCADMVEHLGRLSEQGLRGQLLELLNDDPGFLNSDDSPDELLLALCSISDDLGTEGSYLTSEYDVARRIWFKRFSDVPEAEKFTLLKTILERSEGITLPLLILEELRDKNDAKFCDGASAHESIPSAEPKQIEGLTDSLISKIRERVQNRLFPISIAEGTRVFRLAHAIGPKRLEPILDEMGYGEPEVVLGIAKAVLVSSSPQFHTDLREVDSESPGPSKHIVTTLEQFASRDFWERFAKEHKETSTLDEFETAVLGQFPTGIDALLQEPASEEEGQ